MQEAEANGMREEDQGNSISLLPGVEWGEGMGCVRACEGHIRMEAMFRDEGGHFKIPTTESLSLRVDAVGMEKLRERDSILTGDRVGGGAVEGAVIERGLIAVISG